MRIHTQLSDHRRAFYDLAITDPGTGALSIPAGTFWLHDVAYALPAYAPTIGTNPFRLWVEQTATGADYRFDLTLDAVPVSFGKDIGACLVAWRDTPTGDIHVLRSVQA